MSGQQNNDDGTNFSRRTFMKTTGLLAAAGAAGAGVPSAAAHGGFHGEFANWRVREAKKVWDRGYRGRPDRAIGLTDSGIDTRHPDLGPWNGVQATIDDEELVLTGPELDSRGRESTGRTVEESGTAGPGTFATGDEVIITEFTLAKDEADEVDATLSWEPYAENGNDLELRLDKLDENGEWKAVQTAATGGMPEKLNGVQVSAGDYRFVAEQYKNISCTYTLNAEFYEYVGTLETYEDGVVFEENDDGDLVPVQQRSDAPDAMPKTIGWFNETSRYGTSSSPSDPDGHGSHCASIMGGSGRASQPDPDTVVEEAPRTVLTAGDTLEYEIDAEAGTGVFISAYGDGIELIIEAPDGRELDSSTVGIGDTSEYDNNVAEAPAEQTGTYTAYVRAAEGELASTARVEKVSAGAFLDHADATGDRSTDGDTTVHAGMAPNASLVGLQGLSDPTVSLGEYANEFSSIFNLRTVNMSWGYLGGLPLGGFGEGLDGGVVAAVKKAADAGILTVAAAGNAATPANGNGAPAVADEAISVVSTGPLDGIVAYSSGGLGGRDEADGDTYMKPDVTAPGGALTDLINAADIGSDGDEYGDVRDYTGKAGTSMASPYTNGMAGLVAEAMEFDAPDALSIKEPANADYDDVKKLKHVILSTASETAFTAAPYHRAHNPVYTHGGRDPYEGFGRINPDAAVDAVTRELLDGTEGDASADFSEDVGLGIPDDSRAVAGYVQTRGGTLDVDVGFSHYSGGNKGMTKDNPHLDLFVYDSEPGANGEPNIVASDQGESGTASVSVDVPTADAGSNEPNEETYFVVVKLVNVPGVVNGYDVQAHFDLGLNFTAGEIPLPSFEAAGNREVDSSVVSGRQANRVQLTVSELDGDAVIRDRFPEEWRLLPFGQGTQVEPGIVEFDTNPDTDEVDPVTEDDVQGDKEVTFTYFVEAEDSIEDSDLEHYGPAIALPENADEFDNDQAEFAGEDDVILVGVDV